MLVKISQGNTKMGKISSVSLPAGKTCRKNCLCYKDCYARRIEARRPNVKNAYQNNYEILLREPDTYWREVEAAIMMSRFFRFHVSGDIPDMEYLKMMIQVSNNNPHCQILCFTKMYEIVNEYVDSNGLKSIPSNLHIIFSIWPDIECDNKYNLPESHVRFKDGTTTASKNAMNCGGNCSQCALASEKCWVLRFGEQVVFDKH